MDNSPEVLKEGELLAAVNELQAGFAIYNEDLSLNFANETIRNFLPQLYENLDAGLTLQESMLAQVQKVFPDLAPKDRLKRVEHIINTIKSSGAMDVTTPEGRHLSSVYKRTASHKYMLVTMDVTERIHQREELERAKHEAQSANDAKTDFLASMSHELRTPLAGIYSAAQILHKRIQEGHLEGLEEFTQIVLGSTAHLKTVINDVLSISKIEAGQVLIKPESGSLRDLLHAITKTQNPIAIEKGLKLNLVIDRNVPSTFVFDGFRVRQCVTNLVSNALKFTVEGSVTIAAQYDDVQHKVKLHVADTGIGMSPDEAANVFDKFTQANGLTQEKFGGTGLGLTISKKLAQLMGGTITVVSERGRGTIFTFTFTARPAEMSKDIQVSAA
ncbi:sensor histidine kinase [Hellea balneolensis]|uniref:sensor histidine kinase n=1 Tax=Hellea balneolensis TaxID=287478 RepID=UPI00041B6CBD|nr:ATP-binding protein [Hellea balneolensis]